MNLEERVAVLEKIIQEQPTIEKQREEQSLKEIIQWLKKVCAEPRLKVEQQMFLIH